VLNAAPAIALPAALLEAIDVLIANEHEAEALAALCGVPPSPESFAVAMQQRFGCATIVTLGPRGAVAALRERVDARAGSRRSTSSTRRGQATPSSARSPRRSTAGALWPRALAEALAAGSLACTRAGAQAALRAAAEIASRRRRAGTPRRIHADSADQSAAVSARGPRPLPHALEQQHRRRRCGVQRFDAALHRDRHAPRRLGKESRRQARAFVADGDGDAPASDVS
jgi:hypothetical protein